MKTPIIIFALATAVFAAPALADHNRTDEQGRKQGHWTEEVPLALGMNCSLDLCVPEYSDEVHVIQTGHYVDDEMQGHWVIRFVNFGPGVDAPPEELPKSWTQPGNMKQVEGPMVNDKPHGNWVVRLRDGTVWEGAMVDGTLHGQWVGRHPDGKVEHWTYRDGEKVE